MTDRSTRAQVINPVLAIPAVVAQIDHLTLPERKALRSFLQSISADARIRAEKSWRTHKAPMALYWKCVAVYTNHLARALR